MERAEWPTSTHVARPRMVAAIVLSTVLLFLSSNVPMLAGDAATEVRSALTQWMADFNAGKTERVCELFATDIRADFRGYPTRDHKAVCDLLAKSLTNKTRVFSYALDIKEILVFGDVAVVRLVRAGHGYFSASGGRKLEDRSLHDLRGVACLFLRSRQRHRFLDDLVHHGDECRVVSAAKSLCLFKARKLAVGAGAALQDCPGMLHFGGGAEMVRVLGHQLK